jgi:hypothetical protein
MGSLALFEIFWNERCTLQNKLENQMHPDFLQCDKIWPFSPSKITVKNKIIQKFITAFHHYMYLKKIVLVITKHHFLINFLIIIIFRKLWVSDISDTPLIASKYFQMTEGLSMSIFCNILILNITNSFLKKETQILLIERSSADNAKSRKFVNTRWVWCSWENVKGA